MEKMCNYGKFSFLEVRRRRGKGKKRGERYGKKGGKGKTEREGIRERDINEEKGD